MTQVTTIETAGFYADLTPVTEFDRLTQAANFADLPDDWIACVSDIQGSTQEIANGRYKTVNMVGAAVISAQINLMAGQDFPFVFGGDGAAFAIWPEKAEATAKTLQAVQRWALAEFDITLRTALVPVSKVIAAGHHIGVAKYQPSNGATYAMFSGGGISWAEQQMKDGVYGLDPAPVGTVPDLTGLSCRWSPLKSQNGVILSLVMLPVGSDRLAEFARVAGQVIALAQGLDRAGHPVPMAGPGTGWPPPGTALEAHAQRGTGSLRSSRAKVLFETAIAWVLFRTGWKVGGFDARHYARVTGQNADYRKFDDGLKMTLDCDADTLAKITTVLEQGQAIGAIKYGTFQQDSAMMTCIVPSIMRDDHIHFVDGASGGYTQAATVLKNT